MPNPPMPLPGTTIQAVWGQAATTRLVPVYQNTTARDAAIPTPEDGQMAYIIDDDVLTVRIAGVLWVTLGVGTFVQVSGDAMEGTLDMNGQPLTGLRSAVASTDAVHRAYADARYLGLHGGTMTGPLGADGGITMVDAAIPLGAASPQFVVRETGDKRIHRLSYHGRPRVHHNGTVATDANGDFAVPTGFIVSFASAVSTSVAYPAYIIIRELNSTQVVFRAYSYPSVVPFGNTTISVTYQIWGE